MDNLKRCRLGIRRDTIRTICQIALSKTKLHSTHVRDIVWFLVFLISISLYPPLVKGYTGVSNAPLTPASTVIKTVCASGCNYSTIQAAIYASRPGWTIRVKNGTYREAVYIAKNCTKSKPCSLMAYPGHDPVIDGKGKNNNGIFLRGSWWIIEGLEIKNAKFSGFKVNRPNNTLRNNYTHHNQCNNGGAGILVIGGANDVLVENNISEFNGTDPGTCLRSEVSSPRHCHAVYLGNGGSTCLGIKNVTVRGNTLRNQGGAGIQINSSNCKAPNNVSNFLFENNLIQNTSIGFTLFKNANDGVIRNNTVVLDTVPQTNEVIFAFIHMWGTVTGNKIKNNIFDTTRPEVKGLSSFDAANANNDLDYNLFHMVGNNWMWLGKARSDFKTNYRSVTSWDKNGKFVK